MKINHKSLGFTLIELLVAATIIILLTTIGVVSYHRASINSRNAKRKADLETVRQAMIMYRSDQGTYPGGDDFTLMVGNLKAEGYLMQEDTFEDPGSFYYTYNPTDRYLEATLEESGATVSHRVSLP
jgi:general secretion pathway protein G